MVKSLLRDGLASKIYQYTREIDLCFKMGADFKSRLALAAATLQFHLTNGLGTAHRRAESSPKCYRIQLGHRSVDLWLRPYIGDFFIFHEVFLGRRYWIPQAWRERVTNIIDLGAHIGLATLFFTQYFPTARYICIEPNSANAEILRRNVSCLGERVHIIEGAISDHSGETGFDDSAWSWGGHLSEDRHFGRSVRCYSMEEILTACGLSTIDILKVHIEGAEKKLFGTRGEWLARVKLILVSELHGAYSLQDLTEDLTPMGFKVLPPNSEYGNQMILALPQEGSRINPIGI